MTQTAQTREALVELMAEAICDATNMNRVGRTEIEAANAALLRLLDAERAELDKEQVSHLKTRAKLTEIREAASLLVRTWQERNPMRTADFHPPPCDCYRCLYDALAAAIQGKAP